MKTVLSKPEFEAVYQRALAVDLPMMERSVLLAGLPSRFVGHMPTKREPIPQLLSDLTCLNRHWRVPGCSGPPLLAWLRNAACATEYRADVRLFVELGDRLDLRRTLMAVLGDDSAGFTSALDFLTRPEVHTRIGGLTAIRGLWGAGDAAVRLVGRRLLIEYLRQRQALGGGAPPEDDSAVAVLQLGDLSSVVEQATPVNLRRLDLRALTLDGVRLPDADLTGVDLSGARARRADLRSTDLRNASLVRADLKRGRLQNADLSGGTLTDARFNEARLRDARLKDVDAARVSFLGAALQGADFCGSRLQGARFGRVRAGRADFSGCVLAGAGFRRAHLPAARFVGARLEQSMFVGAVLRGADFRDADLEGASFDDADLCDAVFTHANLRGVSLRGARISATTRFPSTVDLEAAGVTRVQ